MKIWKFCDILILIFARLNYAIIIDAREGGGGNSRTIDGRHALSHRERRQIKTGYICIVTLVYLFIFVIFIVLYYIWYALCM